MLRAQELDGPELSNQVGVALGWKKELLPITKRLAWFDDRGRFTETVSDFCPAEDWGQAGPLLEARQMGVIPDRRQWMAICDGVGVTYGDTPLIAICRAFVRAVSGDEVEE